MSWRAIHRWVGLWAGSVAVVLGITGMMLAFFPVRDAWQAAPVDAGLTVSVLAQRVSETIPGIEEIRRLPSGDIVVYSFDGNQPRASRVDPADGRVLGDYQPSAVERWVKNLHRSFLLGDAGRLGAAGIALAISLLSISGLVLMVRRMGGWRQVFGRVRGSLAQRIHVVTGRILLVVLCLSALTGLYMSGTTFSVIPVDTGAEPEVMSTPGSGTDLSVGQLPLLQVLRVKDLRKLNVPYADDPSDTWAVSTAYGKGWLDRTTGRTLDWVPAGTAQRVYDWVYMLHTGQGLWVWALILGGLGACIPLFWASGFLIWLRTRRQVPKLAHNSALRQADVLIFVASEGGSTWGFAQALHEAFVHTGHRVHAAGLEHFEVGESARQVFVLAATYGDGQAPAHAAKALSRIARHPAGTVPVTVLGFGDRQFAAFCGYAEAVDQALRTQGWPQALPLERIHQQSAQQFERWGAALSQVLNEALVLNYVPRVPPTTPLTLLARRDYEEGIGGPTVILRFEWPRQPWLDRLKGRGLRHFEAGDLVGILAPGSAVPRFYSLASGYEDGFLEICVRKMPDGLCSGHLHALQPGDQARAFIKPNPDFALDGPRSPVVLIGAGTGVAPLAGFIRGNARRTPMHLYYGARDPAKDFYFGEDIQGWLDDQRLTDLRTAFSRVPDGGGYVQDALRRDATRLRDLVSAGAILRICGSRPMAQGVAEALDGILATVGLSVRQLKTRGRYAEDVF